MSYWDDPDTASYYEAFCESHSRYAEANQALVARAQVESGMRVLDLAAGSGRTAEAALDALGPKGRVLCVEPAAAMRTAGRRRLSDPRVEWSETLPEAMGSFDRILCGAAMWQLEPVPETFQMLARLLRCGGALCFNIPALYLQEPDQPGGGADPLLLSLPSLLVAELDCLPMRQSSALPAPLDSRRICAWLRTAGFRAQPWSFRVRMTQEAYAAWLKIPILTDGMFCGVTPEERARRIDVVLESVDRSSWKWERWRGWTAWKY